MAAGTGRVSNTTRWPKRKPAGSWESGGALDGPRKVVEGAGKLWEGRNISPYVGS